MKQRLKMLILLFCALIVITLVTISFNPTSSRYIKTVSDEILATYTSLYFDTTGEGKSVSLDSNIGYVNFELMNFIGEDVTQRDIEYTISTPTTFYDDKAVEIINPTNQNDLHVLDLWGQPKKIGNDTCNYTTSIVSNDGERSSDRRSYKFTYEKLNNSAVGKTHNVIVKLERKDTAPMLSGVENVSIVISLTKPYREVYIINITISDKLITFSTGDEKLFEIDTKSIYIQSSNIYSHYETSGVERVAIENNLADGTITRHKYSSKAIKLTFEYSNILLNKKILDESHIPYGVDSSNIDITKPYIENINNQNNGGSLTMYIPQGSDLKLNFIIPYGNNEYNIKVKIEIFVDSETSLNGQVTNTSSGYVLYTENVYKGYEFDVNSDYYTLLNFSK